MQKQPPEVFYKKGVSQKFHKISKISQNSQENTCARVSFLATLLKKRLRHKFSPVNFVKFLRKPF